MNLLNVHVFSLTYDNVNAIICTSVKLFSSTVYVSQQNNYATLTLNYTMLVF